MDIDSEKRMRGMLERAGVDSDIAMHGELDAIIDEVRRQCRDCQNEDLCARWLAGKVVKGGNSFCPNARVLRNLARTIERTD